VSITDAPWGFCDGTFVCGVCSVSCLHALLQLPTSAVSCAHTPACSNLPTSPATHSGYHYYVNHKTGETSWEKPKVLGSEDLDDDQQHTGDGDTAAAGYDDAAAQVQVEGVEGGADAGAAVLDTTSPDYVDATGYAQVWDESSQSWYYFNAETQDTQWEAPPGWGTPAAHHHALANHGGDDGAHAGSVAGGASATHGDDGSASGHYADGDAASAYAGSVALAGEEEGGGGGGGGGGGEGVEEAKGSDGGRRASAAYSVSRASSHAGSVAGEAGDTAGGRGGKEQHDEVRMWQGRVVTTVVRANRRVRRALERGQKVIMHDECKVRCVWWVWRRRFVCCGVLLWCVVPCVLFVGVVRRRGVVLSVWRMVVMVASVCGGVCIVLLWWCVCGCCCVGITAVVSVSVSP